MVCGTTSDAGKTTVVAGLCRLLQRQGVSVAPFKAQNMALNSAVTKSGHEIGRAQYLQAQAARVEPEVAMNPILLKPTSQRSSQVVVMGKPVGVMSAVEYHDAKPDLFMLVQDALEDLRSRFDVVLIEGAGSPAEINLLPHDIVNLRLAEAADLPAIVVGDIDPGGVFASLYGTVAILPDNLSSLIQGFVINKFRGDPALLLDGTDQLQTLTNVATLGIVPVLEGLQLDAEDSLALERPRQEGGSESLDVAVIRFPHISNFTDLDPLVMEDDVSVRYVRTVRELGKPDLIVLPGTKATVNDLTWLRAQGLDQAIIDLVAAPDTGAKGPTILGICGGYQMLGGQIEDDVEGPGGLTEGLGLLPVQTVFDSTKTLQRVEAVAMGQPIKGYQIHHGRVSIQHEATTWLTITDPTGDCSVDSENDSLVHSIGELVVASTSGGQQTGIAEGARAAGVFGTTLHGLFDEDAFRRAFLSAVASRVGTTFTPTEGSASGLRDIELDRLADHLDQHLDMAAIRSLISLGAKQ